MKKSLGTLVFMGAVVATAVARLLAGDGVGVAAVALVGLLGLLWFGGRDVVAARASGEAAELDAVRTLRDRLPAAAVVLRNVLIPDGRSSVGSVETDVLAVTPAGVFVIEVKSHDGSVLASNEAQDWKVARGGGLRNPVRQVNRQIGAIRTVLKRWGVDAPVHGAVYMPNARVRRLGKLSVPVFSDRRFLAPFVLAKGRVGVVVVGEVVKALEIGARSVVPRC